MSSDFAVSDVVYQLGQRNLLHHERHYVIFDFATSNQFLLTKKDFGWDQTLCFTVFTSLSPTLSYPALTVVTNHKCLYDVIDLPCGDCMKATYECVCI